MRAPAIALIIVLVFTSGCQSGGQTTPSSATRGSAAASAPASGDARSGSIAVAVGQVASLNIGQYNASVGDSWGVLSDSTTGVVDSEIRTESVQATPMPGSPSDYYLTLTGRTAGRTVLLLRYCYRTALSATCDQGPRKGADYANITLAVTVS